jgi:U3 small nucleolar RNA-associated protein 4
LFFLRTSKKKGSGVLRVQKISIPDTLPLRKIELENDSDDSSDDDDIDLAETGARLLRFSPNGKQLLVITPDSKALLVNLSVIAPDNRKEKASVNILPPVFELQRGISALPKSFHQIQKTTPSKKRSQQKQDEGTLPRGYLSTVVKAAFSSTSQLLAIADLSGNITTFSLQPTPFRITASIPRLSSQPVILSFRPVPSLPPPISTNDKMDESSDESSDEDAPPPDAQLLAITADTHSIHLFSAASGRLAPWSKRNPMPSCLPADFAAVGDRAVGAFWESGSTDRLWCHGASWVWMFDFSRDWPNHEARLDSGGLGGKRKRGEENAVPAESISGAGSLMQIPMVPSMAKTYVTASEPKPKSKPQSKHKTIPDAKSKGYENHENERSDDENDDDDDDEIGGGVQLTRVNSHKKGNKKMGQKPFWGSFRYRSLLGVLPVGEREAVKMLKTFGDDWGAEKNRLGV